MMKLVTVAVLAIGIYIGIVYGESFKEMFEQVPVEKVKDTLEPVVDFVEEKVQEIN